MSPHVWPTIHEAISHASRSVAGPLAWDPDRPPALPLLLRPDRARAAPTSRRTASRAGTTSRSSTAPPTAATRATRTSPRSARCWRCRPTTSAQYLREEGNEFGWDAMDQLTQVTLGLQAWSKAQLYETLVDFFSNHLNVPNHNGDVWVTRHAYDRDVIRKHAMGSFTDMLLASSKHPAMLRLPQPRRVDEDRGQRELRPRAARAAHRRAALQRGRRQELRPAAHRPHDRRQPALPLRRLHPRDRHGEGARLPAREPHRRGRREGRRRPAALPRDAPATPRSTSRRSCACGSCRTRRRPRW